jgi:hypothetical protein
MAKGLGIFMDCCHLGSSPSGGSLGGRKNENKYISYKSSYKCIFNIIDKD